MPRDPRLYMTFPNDFHRHPKLLRLPVEVRWTFVEMNGEARIADNDGRFSAEDAEFMWPAEHLAALVTSHPTRPLVIQEVNGGDYVIREYSEHQETRASREARAAKNRANGAKGGRPRKNPDQTESEPIGFQFGSESVANRTQHKAESESESEIEDSIHTSKSQSRDNRASDGTDSEVTPIVGSMASRQGITSLPAVAEAIRKHVHRTLSPNEAFRVAIWILQKPKTPPRAPQRYVTTSISRTPLEVAKYIDDNAIGGAA